MIVKRRISAFLTIAWLAGLLGWSLAGLPAAQSASAVKETVRPPLPSDHLKIGDIECKECHSELVENKTLHPVAADCANCHEYKDKEESGEISFVLEGNSLCMMCHADKQEDLESKKSKHAAVEAGCVFCHTPHSSAEPVLLKEKVNGLCYVCHSDKQEELAEPAFGHAPIKDVGCVACHNPHTSNDPPLLKVAVNDLCLACHRMNAESRKDKVSLAVLSQPLVPADYAKKAKNVPLDRSGRGHPYMRHPVAHVPDPSDPGKKMSCLSCHDPHAGKNVQMYKGGKNKTELCASCHK